MLTTHKKKTKVYTNGYFAFSLTMLMVLSYLPSVNVAVNMDFSFGTWLKQYIPSEYPDTQYVDYGTWFQARIPGGLFVSWGAGNGKAVSLKDVRELKEGKPFFVDQSIESHWANHPGVKYFRDAGYYCSGYRATSMSDWNVENCTVVQFNGESQEFVDLMAAAWHEVKHLNGNQTLDDQPEVMNPTANRMRVVISAALPPMGVALRGDVPNVMKGNPDDTQSLIRFLLYANEFDIEGLIASSATYANQAQKQHILGVLDCYEKAYDNLSSHDPWYPTTEHLRSVTFQGRSGTWGKSVSHNIGVGKDSEASEAIIRIVDRPDPRPVWIGVWGDCSNVAQAVWKVKNTRSTTELERFLSKMRIHQIAHQDGTIDWLRNNFPNLFIVHSNHTYQGMFGGDDPISDLSWINKNIRQNHGPLGDIYPHEGMGCTGVCEGDSPTFMYLVSANRGINNPEDPTQPSWGGQYKRVGSTNHYVDGPGPSSISRWRAQVQAEFAERADWMLP